MGKIKGWKKTSKNFWKNEYNKNKSVTINPYNKSYIVQNEQGFNAKGLISIVSSKIKANKHATRYMREHSKGY